MKIGAGLTVFALLLAATPMAFAQQPTQEAIAQVRFSKGRDLFIAGKFAEALVEFRGAGEMFESPNTRMYIGRCERELGHLAAAYVELERAASEAADRAHGDPRYASTRDAAKAEASALEGKLGHVKILAPDGLPPGTAITLNGVAIATAGVGVTAPIDPGAVEVNAHAPGYVPLHRTAQVAAGESVEIKIHLDAAPQTNTTTTTANTNTNTSTSTNNTTNIPNTTTASGGETDGTEAPARDTAPHPGRGLRTGGFVVGGIGIASMGVFAAFAALAQTRFDQLKAQCNGPCDPSLNAKIDEGQTYQTVANIALATGGAALVVGAIMIVAGVSAGGPAPSAQPSALRATVVPVFSAQGPAGVMFGVGHDF